MRRIRPSRDPCTDARSAKLLLKTLVWMGRAGGLLAVATLLAIGCSDPDGAAPVSSYRLTPGQTYTSDLDGDRALEEILVEKDGASLAISDGDVVYRSRDKWRVVEAYVGDTDHNGLPEVVTLLDAEDGRHLGLFAYFGGEYRERLVTSEIVPPPVAIEVINFEEAAEKDNPDLLVTLAGDLVLLTQEPAPGETRPRQTLLRWNGFGFTGVGPPAP